MITFICICLVLIAPWFFMMARLKNMGYTRHDVKRFFDDFGWLIGAMVIISLLLGAVADVIFNWLVGSIIFREIPKEFFFTARVERWAHVFDVESERSYAYSKRAKLGSPWRDRLNRIMAGHV